MINENKTLQLFGYTSDQLTKGSHKRIVRICDECSKEDIIDYSNYIRNKHPDLCQSCTKKNRIFSNKHKRNLSKSGKNRYFSKEYRIKLSCGQQGISRNEWNGFIHNKIRDHVLPVNQCIKLNSKFPESHAHHIMSNVVIFIPKELHRSISHSMKNSKNMDKINELALSYLINK